MKLLSSILLSAMLLGATSALAQADCSKDLSKTCAIIGGEYPPQFGTDFEIEQIRFAGSNVWYYLTYDGSTFDHTVINQKTGEAIMKSKKDGEKVLVGTLVDTSNLRRYAYIELKLNGNLSMSDKATPYKTKTNCIRTALGVSQRYTIEGLRHELTVHIAGSTQTALFFGDEIISKKARICLF